MTRPRGPVEADGFTPEVSEFEGHVCAKGGIDLIAGATGAPSNDRKIIWHVDSCSGAVVAEIRSYQIGGISAAELRAHSPDGAGHALIAPSASDAESFVRALAVNDDGSESRLIIEDDGKSDFVQLVNSADLKLVHGRATLPADGGNVSTVMVNHGLGRIPIRAFATVFFPVKHTVLSVDQYSNTQFRCIGQTNDLTAFAAQNFEWLVIG